MIKKIVVFFHRKKMVYSRSYPPAQLYRFAKLKGIQYAQVIQTNHVDGKGRAPLYNIPQWEVLGIRYIPSPFDLWLDKTFGRKRSKKVVLHKIKTK